MTKRKGFEGKFYYGVAGSTASTELTIVTDVDYKGAPTLADVSTRASIIKQQKVTQVDFVLNMTCMNDDSNAFVAAARTACYAGSLLAIRTRDKSAGFGVDGDFNVDMGESQPLTGAQELKFSFTPCDDNRVAVFA